MSFARNVSLLASKYYWSRKEYFLFGTTSSCDLFNSASPCRGLEPNVPGFLLGKLVREHMYWSSDRGNSKCTKMSLAVMPDASLRMLKVIQLQPVSVFSPWLWSLQLQSPKQGFQLPFRQVWFFLAVVDRRFFHCPEQLEKIQRKTDYQRAWGPENLVPDKIRQCDSTWRQEVPVLLSVKTNDKNYRKNH